MNTFKASDFDDLFGITPEQRNSVNQQPTDTQTTQLPAAEQQSFKVNPSAIKASDFDDLFGITPEDRISAIQKQKAIAEDSSDFIAGTKRGVQNLQASLYGATGLVGKGLQSIGAEETGKKLQDYGFEGYRRNTAEAAQTPAKYSFKDIYTGKAGVGGAIDWAQGTLGELVPSMVEAAIGAVVGSFAAPGAGTVAGGLAGRTVLKKSIDEAVGKLVKEGADAAVANQVRKQVTNQALKKLGGKVGMGAAVMPMEAGGMYGELFESHGVDAPETALLFGALATSLEFLGGNSKLVDVFVDSLAKGAKGTAKKSAKEILSNIPEEALQEGGQELMNILNTVVNTDEKLLTLDNVERIVESMAAGAVGGGFGSATNVVMDGKQLNKPSELDQKVDNIASGGVENIQKALNEFDRQDAFNTELLNNPEKLEAQAAEFGVTPERLSDNIGSQIMANKQLRERLNIELAKPVEEVKKEEPLTDDALKARIEDVRRNHDVLVDEQKNREQKINNFNNQINRLSDILSTTTDNNRKNLLREQISGIIKSRNELVGQTEIANQEIKAYREFGAPKKSDELYAEKQKLYESIWTDRDKGVSPEEDIPIGIQPSYTDPEKSAVVSGAIINENYPQIEQKLIQLREDIANEYDYERRREMQKTYDELFVDYEQKKSATESVNVFEKAGIGRGQVADLRDVEQVPLTDQQQVIVDQNNLKINDLNNQLNRTIDRDERISLLQQIDELDKVNAEIRTPIENISQVGNELLGTDETSAFKNEQQVGTPEIDNNQYTEEPINLETRSNIRQTKKLSLADISKIFPNQEVSQDETGKISVRFKNGKGATFQSIEDAGQGYIKFAIETGQMSKNGKILGITVGSDVLLDANFADNQTLWHENKHVLDNLGLITKEDDSLLNAEFNRLRNAGKLRFSLSTHEDPRQRMIENRANTFAQIMLDREAYRNKPLGKTIQRILDFFQQLLSLGQQSIASFAREVESGKIYERQASDNAFPVMKNPMFTFAGMRATTADSDKMFKAQKMRNSGFSREAIWNNTGWWEIVPGSDIWSFEIDDSKSVWNLELFNKAVNKIEQDIKDSPNKTLSPKLSNLFTHPDLFNQYPFLRDIKVVLNPRLEGRGAYDEKNQRIHISTKQVADQETNLQEALKGVILHEVQHAIQAHEGFARGGNSKQEQKIVENQFALRKLKKVAPTIKNPLDKESIEELITTIQKELEEGKINETWPNYLKELADYFMQNDEFYAARELSTNSASEFWGPVRYQSLTGEAQARLTSFRQQMDADKRKMIPPWISLKQMLTNEGLLFGGKNPEDILISQDANGIAMSEEGSLSDRLNADQIATTPEQIAQTIHPAIMYDGLMKGIPGVVDDLHNFTITLPDGKQPSFSVSGDVTTEKVSEQLNKLMERFGQDPNFEMRSFAAFFSKLQQISDEKFVGMKAQSVEPFLLKQGVKKTEIEATGLREWLAAMKPTDKVTKEQLADFVRANTVEFEDVILGDEYEIDPEMAREFHELDRLSVTGGNLTEEQWRRKAELQRIVDKARDGKQTHFSAYTEPGATTGSYREMFVIAPTATEYTIKKDMNGFYRAYDNAGASLELETDDGTFSALSTRQAVETALKHPFMIGRIGWKDGHSQYSEIQNPIVRIRFNEVTGQNGERILRVEEMQGPSAENQQKMPQYLRDNIYQTGVKRILAYAKENGFDGIALATKLGRTAGETQADRYSLEKQVDTIYYEPEGQQLRVEADGRNEISKTVPPEKLHQYIGKDAAKRLLGSEVEVVSKYGGTKMHVISGDDLRVGGEGLRQLYDTDLPNIFKAWGGAKMRDVGGMPYISIDKAAISYPMFEVRDFTVPEQKLSDEQYNESFRHQNNLLQDVKQIFRMRLHDVKLLADKSMGSISTRLKNVSPLLSSKLRILDFTTSQKIVKALREAKPILEATKGMSKEDKFVWDLARKNADAGKVQQLATKYGILENVQTLRNTLNNIRKEAEEVGYDVGFLDEYWPRIIKDTEGFLQATQEISEQPVFSNAIKAKAKAMGLTVEKFNNEYPEVKADIISNLILGRGMGIGGPGNIQSRVYNTIPRELEQYYMDSDAALMQYIYSMTKKIEARKFFGKVPERIMKLKTAKKNKQTELIKLQELARLNPAEAEINAEKIEQLQEDIIRIDEPLEQYKHRRDYTENIGTYIDDLMMAGILNKKDEKMVRDILDARFHEYGTHGPINAYKNFSYIDVMGSPISAITQIGDLAWAMYVGKVWTPSGFSNTIKNIINATFNKSNITKEDLGIERIAQEFADGTTLSNAVSWVFNRTGLSKIDSIGKEALINNALDQYKRQVQSEAGRTKLISDIRATFGPQSESVIQDLLTNNNSDNVKMLLYSRLLDFQPVALSEMPEYYLKAGNGRVFYMLKTYTLKQMDVFRKEVWHTMKNGDAQQKLEGIKNLVQLMSLLTLANAGADEIKDWLLGKESKFKDHVIENFLTMGGASRYIRMQVTQDGLGSTLAGKILPPFKFINSLSKDVIQGYKDYVSGDTSNLTDLRVLESVPIAGKWLYWHIGRGAEYKESIAEQEFKKAGKAANLFKKQLENSKDKRLFLQANLNDFRQMKLHENSQSSLNKIQATINKLEKMEQTTNVIKRIGQLNNHKERIMTDYLKRVEGLTAQ